MAYDYTVLAGTQGMWNHFKKDRMFELAERWRLPLVFFTEGGGAVLRSSGSGGRVINDTTSGAFFQSSSRGHADMTVKTSSSTR